jgi:peptidoglycan/LPS O-acetylase OafA/YrhL
MGGAASFKHVPQLDGVRALAVLIVMVSHGGLTIIPGGFGVTIFFFLSGYLITSLLRAEWQKTGAIDLRAFYLRRTLRIMPPLYITLLLLTVLAPTGIFGTNINWAAVPWDYLFLSNYSHLWHQDGGLPVPLWSLAVEEHFYLAFPLTFLLLAKSMSQGSIATFCFWACAVVLALRVLTLLVDDSQAFRNYYWSHTRIDSIFFGSCLALFQNPVMDEDAWRPRYWHAAAAIAVILAGFVIRDDVFRETIRYTLQGFALFVIFSFILSGKSALLTRFLSCKPMVWIGLLSYTLYLCHFAIFAAFKHNLPISRIEAGLLGFPVAFLFAYLMRVLVEVPILDWRRQHRQRVKAIVTAAP